VREKKWLLKSLFFVLLAGALIFGIEATVYIFSRAGKINLASRDDIRTAAKSGMEDSKAPAPVYIPHPYFGYVYTPSSRVSIMALDPEFPMYTESNSEGFIDDEFPTERKEGVCVYGIMGGSAAMSWGMNQREHRISYHLEKMLNDNLRNSKCREYRVLNMGIGSHTLYQASQIYLYYKNLLDGIIFFGGFNECAHGAMLTNNEPVQFPVINIYASLQIPSPLIGRITEERRGLAKRANFLLKHPYLIYSPSVRFLFKLKEKRIEKLQARLQDEGHQAMTLPGIKGKYKEKLRGLFPKLTALGFLQSYDYDNPDVPKVIEKVLPLVYTEPVLNTYAVSKTANAHFLSVIQPMMYITGKETNWKALNFASYHFQKTCVEELKDEARKLEAHGIKTYNLNEINKNGYKKDFFIDQAHMTNEGNRTTARSLFEIIKKEWNK